MLENDRAAHTGAAPRLGGGLALAGRSRRTAPAAGEGRSGQLRCALGGLTGSLGASAEGLLIGVSVYREPVDRNAVLFQVGEHDWTAARAPDRQGPAPPYQAPDRLAELIAACESSGLLSVGRRAAAGSADQAQTVFVDRWIASDLHRLLAEDGRGAELARAHRRAAEYWQWRSAAWPQGRRADLHDLLQGRLHLFDAGEAEQGSALTEVVCAQLHAWGDLGREAALIHETLDRLPGHTALRASWLRELGKTAEAKGDYGQAERHYQQALDIFATAGDGEGVARSYHSLGVLAQARGEYAQAEAHYEQSATAAGQPGAAGARDLAGRTGQAPPAGSPREGPKPATPATGESAAGESGSGASVSAGPPPVVPPGGGSAPDGHPGPPGDCWPVDAEPGADWPAATVMSFAPSRASLLSAPGPLPSTLARSAAPRLVPVPGLARRPAASPPARRLRQRASTRRRLASLAAAVAGIAAITAAVIPLAARPALLSARLSGARTGTAAAATRRVTARWIGQHASGSAIVACDLAMCAALQARGLPSGNLVVVGPGGSADPLGANLVVATAAVRSLFSSRLGAVYAPVVLARFGSGGARIDVRIVAPDGSAAYLSELRSDVQARRDAGLQMLLNRRLSESRQARQQLAAGQVDARVLTTLPLLAAIHPLDVLSFGGAGPGASSGVPLSTVTVAGSAGASAGSVAALLALLRAQRAPYLAASARVGRLGNGRSFLQFGFAQPSPLGLLAPGGSTQPTTRPSTPGRP